MRRHFRWFGSCFAAVIVSIVAWHSPAFGEGKSIFDDNWTPPVTQPAPNPAAVPGPIHPEPAPGPVNPPVVTPPAQPGPVNPSVPAPPALPPVPNPMPPPVKLVPPDVAGRAPVLKLVKEIFDKEYANKAPAGKQALARTLLSEADKIEKNYVARYVLLDEALANAMAAADIETCRKVIDDLSRFYAIDADEMTIEAMLKVQNSAGEEMLAAWGLEAAQGMIEAENYQGARRILRIVSQKIARSNDPAQRSSLKTIDATLVEYDKVRPALDKLKTEPGDPPANLAAGKFYCFFRHNFVKGFPLLSRGNDLALKELARKDSENPVDAKARFQLGGYWWDLGQDRAHASLQAALRDRARYWYTQALPELGGLEKAMADKRLADATTPAVASNLISKMKLEGMGTPVEGGAIRISSGRLKTPEDVAVPFKAEFVAKTDSTNIRLGFNRGIVILNWELRPTELRFHDPATGHITPVRGAGAIPVEKFVQVTWIVLPDVSRVYVDGVERGAFRGNYRNLHGPVSIYPSNGSTITVKSVNITAGRE